MTDNATPDPAWSTSLIKLLELQQTLVDELDQLSAEQSGHIEHARTDALLGLLTRRQHIIDRFAGTQDELGRLTEGLEARLDTLDADSRERIQTLIGGIADRLAGVMASDEKDQHTLEAARGGSRREIESVDAVQHARRAYLGPRTVNNRFADRRG